jgi:hypothetical protein
MVFRTSHLASVIASVLLAAMAAAQGVPQASSTSRQVGDFQTVFLINTNADRGVFDNVRAGVQEWGRWKIVGQPEKADLLLVLSEKREIMWMQDPMPIFESIAYYHWPTAIEVDMLTLVVVDRASDRQLLTVSCTRHHFPSAHRWLVSRLRKKIEKSEKSDK